MLPDDVHITMSCHTGKISSNPAFWQTHLLQVMPWDRDINALKPWAVYPVALAEKIAGESLNEDLEGDIEFNINSSINWYLWN
ncbi:MAG: hypothetical protein MZV63_11980 [Marinilabiliales bacterium]|nr:hypothetical protein [Marinilabiliales bacterium]